CRPLPRRYDTGLALRLPGTPMGKRKLAALSATVLGILVLAAPPDGRGQPGEGKKDFFKGFGGPGGPFGGTRKVLKDFDKDGDGRLNAEERQAAREALKKDGGF